MPEYDETGRDRPTSSRRWRTADADGRSRPRPATPRPATPTEAGETALVEPDDELDPVAELRQKLRYAPGDWYVVHSYAGYENKVKTNLETRITSLDMEEFIFQVEVPTREEVEVKNGKRLQVQNKVFPGYILVRMELTPESYSCVRNTPGVTGFVGATDRADRPAPLSLDEVLKWLAPGGRDREQEGQARGQGPRLRGRRLGHGHRRRVRLAAGHDQRDQRRPAEAQGAGLDLRSGDPGRAQLQPGRQDLNTVRRPATLVNVRPDAGASTVRAPRGCARSRAGSHQPRTQEETCLRRRRTRQDLHAAAAGGPGHAGAAGRPRARPARREHHGVLQGVQRADRVASAATSSRPRSACTRTAPSPSSSRPRPPPAC